MNAPKKAAPEVRTQIRLPAALHKKLVAAAKANHRSLNAEMLVRLEASLKA